MYLILRQITKICTRRKKPVIRYTSLKPNRSYNSGCKTLEKKTKPEKLCEWKFTIASQTIDLNISVVMVSYRENREARVGSTGLRLKGTLYICCLYLGIPYIYMYHVHFDYFHYLCCNL